MIWKSAATNPLTDSENATEMLKAAVTAAVEVESVTFGGIVSGGVYVTDKLLDRRFPFPAPSTAAFPGRLISTGLPLGFTVSV